MHKSKLVLLILLLAVAVTAASDAQQSPPVSEQLRLAAVMPSGAMLYVQANNVSALMKRWLASPVRGAYYKSDSFSSFSRSHAYLKLQDRKKDFESALGFGVDEQRLAEIAGGASAVALYDIGRIDVVFVTEVARARAVASALFKQAPRFQERPGNGNSYYVREVTTDGGRLNQQFCFAYADGKLIVTTAEGLMVRALANLKSSGDDSLGSVVLKSAESAEGFSAHDVTMWLDQTRLNASRHFRNYWIHRNSEDLAKIETGLIDLTISGTAINEHRWFKLKSGARTAKALDRNQVSALTRFAPGDAQLVEVRPAAAVENLAGEVSIVLFGELPMAQATPAGVAVQSDSSGESSDDEDSTARSTGRYSHLDNRFDADVDDPDAGGSMRGEASRADSGNFAKALAEGLSAGEPGSYAALVRSRAEKGKPFVRFERALVISLKPGAEVDRGALERAITGELRSRFVVAGSESQFSWEGDGDTRYVSQSLLDRGAAYAFANGHLVVASSKEFAMDIVRSGSSGRASQFADLNDGLTGLTYLRVADAKPVFDTLMSKLDGATPALGVADNDSDSEKEVKFFSQNLSSLIGALNFREVRLARESRGGVLVERVSYLW